MARADSICLRGISNSSGVFPLEARGGVESSDTHLKKIGLKNCRLGLESPVVADHHTAGLAPGPREAISISLTDILDQAARDGLSLAKLIDRYTQSDRGGTFSPAVGDGARKPSPQPSCAVATNSKENAP